MKHVLTALLEECVTEEMVDNYASIESTTFGTVVIGALGINGDCVGFRKSTTKGNYNIGWVLENGTEYLHTYTISEIMQAFKGKTLHIEMEVKRE